MANRKKTVHQCSSMPHLKSEVYVGNDTIQYRAIVRPTVERYSRKLYALYRTNRDISDDLE